MLVAPAERASVNVDSLWLGKGKALSVTGHTVYTVRMVPSESHGTIRTVHTTYAAALKTTTLPKTRCRKSYAATQLLMLLMMGVCTRNMSS